MTDLNGWQSDPFGVHEQRYFSHGGPTKLVRDAGREAYHTVPAAASAPSGEAPPSVADVLNGTAGVQTSSAVEEAAPSGPPQPGWWLASDGNWYPPEAATPRPPEPPAAPAVPVIGADPVPTGPVDAAGPAEPGHEVGHGESAGASAGWWLASDGNWYPPESAPGHGAEPTTVGPAGPEPDVPQPGWWLASDGNWYPPELAPGLEATPAAVVAVPEPVAPAPTVPPVPEVAIAPVQPASSPPPAGPAPADAGPQAPAPGWWLASDGNWYPPELVPAPVAPPASPSQGAPQTPGPAPAPAVPASGPPSPHGADATHAPPAAHAPASTPPRPGWWLASDGNWYPPELAAPDPGPPHDIPAGRPSVPPQPGWWQASDGNWYPPELADRSAEPGSATHPSHPAPSGHQPGWWLASDGNWYPPELAPAAPDPATGGHAPTLSSPPGPPQPGWWLASDGNWYPPELAAPDRPVR